MQGQGAQGGQAGSLRCSLPSNGGEKQELGVHLPLLPLSPIHFRGTFCSAVPKTAKRRSGACLEDANIPGQKEKCRGLCPCLGSTLE